RRRPADLHRADRQGHAVHAQSARRQGLRRGRRDRLAAGVDQRDLQRARRQGRADARVAVQRLESGASCGPLKESREMQAFNYAKPSSLADAARAAGGADAKILAGGQSLLPAMKLGLAAPAALIDLAGLADLKGITVSGGSVKIGAI